MKLINFFTITCLIWLFCQCNDHKEANTGLVITIPKHIEIYNPYVAEKLTPSFFANAKTKIYTSIDASCSACILKLEKWNAFQSDVENRKDVAVIPVCFAEDSFQMLKYVFENKKINAIHLPLVLDLENKFRSQYFTLIDKSGELTFLTDSDNNVILTGNPIENKDDKDRFLSHIPDKH